MINIFNGTNRGIGTANATTFVQFSHEIMPYLRLFSASDWQVFTCLALHMDGNGYCFPSISSIEKITGISPATIRRSLENLSSLSIEGRPVLSIRYRYDRNGRQTSNGYTLFPTEVEALNLERGEGLVFDRGEGIKNDTPITLNKKNIEQEPQGTRVRKSKRTPTLPPHGDPGRLIYESYRSVVYPELDPSAFTTGEWMGARHVVYQMHSRGIDTATVSTATRTLIAKWGGKRDIVTINALWKHWSAATTGIPVTSEAPRKGTMQDVTSGAIDVFRRVTGGAS